jgi:hypothetical protein
MRERAGNFAKDCNQEKQSPSVESAVVRLASLVSSLHSAMDRLQERLRPVLRDESPCTNGKAEAARMMYQNTPLSSDLFDIGDRIETALANLRSMEERIEV